MSFGERFSKSGLPKSILKIERYRSILLQEHLKAYLTQRSLQPNRLPGHLRVGFIFLQYEV